VLTLSPENGKASWCSVTETARHRGAETDSEARHVGQACSEARHVSGGLIDSVAQVVSYGFEFINRYYWLRVYLGEDASEVEICYPRRVFTVVGVYEECQAAHLSELCHLKSRMVSCVTRLAFVCRVLLFRHCRVFLANPRRCKTADHDDDDDDDEEEEEQKEGEEGEKKNTLKLCWASTGLSRGSSHSCHVAC
jgi:hypothetical protein